MAPLPPEELFTLADELPDLRGPDGRGPVLVEMLDGFVDAGAARRIAREHLLAALPSLSALRHRTYRNIFLGSLVSNTGTWMETIAVGIYVSQANWTKVL